MEDSASIEGSVSETSETGKAAADVQASHYLNG